MWQGHRVWKACVGSVSTLFTPRPCCQRSLPQASPQDQSCLGKDPTGPMMQWSEASPQSSSAQQGELPPPPLPPSCRASPYPIPTGPRPPPTLRLCQAPSWPLPWPLLWSMTPEMNGVQVGAQVFPACHAGHTRTTSPWAPTEPSHWSLHPVA